MKLKHLYICILTIFISVFSGYGTSSNADPWPIEKESFQFICSEWPPFEYTGEDGKPTGYSVEILQAILKELSVKDNITIYPWARAYRMVQNEKNVLAFTMARTKAREDLFKWIGPIANREVYLWKLKERSDIKVANWEDAKNYLIGTVRGEAHENELIEKGFEFNKNLKDVTIQLQNYKKLYVNRIDFICGIESATVCGLKKAGFDPSKIEQSFLLSGGLKYYYGFNKNTPDEIVEQFRKALQKIKDNGTFDKIANKYLNAKEN